MATENVNAHPFEITIHICPVCQQDIASGLDANGSPNICAECHWKRRRPAPTPMARKRGRRP